MGNRTSRRRADSKVNTSPKSDGTTGVPAGPTTTSHVSFEDSSHDKKGESCPDLSAGAVPYRDDSVGSTPGQRHVSYTVYRSYSNVAEASRRPEPRPNIRVYRRNTTARYAAGRRGDAAERSQTLPRGFGRSRSAMSGLQSTAGSDVTTLPRCRYTSAGELKRQTASGLSVSGGLGVQPEDRPAKRTTSTISMTSIGYKATADDLPDTATIKRRLAQFETVFARSLSKLYASLPDSVQLSALSVAVRPECGNQHVSLWQYLNSPDVPLDLLADDGVSYALTIQPALFGGLLHVRRDVGDDRAAQTSLAGELVACLAAEAAAELARIFEYQIALLSDGLAIELLAGHAAHCVINYITSTGRLLDRNAIVLGAIRGQHVLQSTTITPRLSVIVGQKELKWELDEILKRAGLRKELFLFTDDIEQVDEDNPPWLFFTSCDHDPMLYGYRGLIIEWNYSQAADCTDSTGVATTTFRLNGDDEASFTDEVDLRPDDFHRLYCPYRRLVGLGVIDRFNLASTENTDVELRASSSLAEFVRRLQGSLFARDQIQPVYRPIAVPSPTTDSATGHDDDQQTARCDDWYAMADDQTQQQAPSVVVNQTNIAVIVTPSTPISNALPVVLEASSEEQPNGTEVGQESVSPVNGERRHVIGNGNVDHREVVEDGIDVVVKPVETTTTIVTRTVVRHINGGGAVNTDDVGDVPLNGSMHTADDLDAIKTSGYVIDETNRRTIRSDL